MKFYGLVGYCHSVEGAGDGEGIWDDVATERQYFGDVLQFNPRWDTGKDVLDDQRLLNRISIVADAFACQHVADLKYVCWQGVKWKVTAVEVLRPRMILTLGGVYHGPTKRAPSPAEESLY
jgi:hypothetical protein